MPPKGSSKARQTRSKARACNTPEVTPATSQILDPEEIIDLETSIDKNDPKVVELTSNADLALEDQNTSMEQTLTIDSNGPVERIATSIQKTKETEPEKNFTLATLAANANQDKIALLDDKRPAASALQVEPENVPDILIDEVLSDGKGTDIIENKVSENLNH